MAIAFDATSSITWNTAIPTSKTWSHTCTGSDLVLIVGIAHEDTTDADRGCSGITYNGVALTKIRTDDNLGDNITSELWYLLGPATGANNIVATFNGGVDDGDCMAISLTGVAQSGQPDAQNGATASNVTSISVDVTTVADNCWVVDAFIRGDGTTGNTVGAGQTARVNETFSLAGAGMSHEGPKTPAGVVTMSWTRNTSGSPDWAISAASFKPVAAAAGTYPGMMTGTGIVY